MHGIPRSADPRPAAGALDRVGSTDLHAVEEAAESVALLQQEYSPLLRGAIKLLVNLPFIGRIPALKQAWGDMLFHDRARLDALTNFAEGLRPFYSPADIQHALKVTNVTPTSALSPGKIREVHQAAKVHRLMNAHQGLLNSVKVVLWRDPASGAPGHLSAMLRHEKSASHAAPGASGDGQTYVSYRPQTAAAAHGASPAMQPSSYAADVAASIQPMRAHLLASGAATPIAGEAYNGVAWGREPIGMLALPMAGDNAVAVHDVDANRLRTLSTMTSFGLDGRAVRAFATILQDGGVPPDDHAVTARLLEAGGAAALRPMPRGAERQDLATMSRYAADLMQDISVLNVHADTVDDVMGGLFRATSSMLLPFDAPTLLTTHAQATRATLATLPTATRTRMAALDAALGSCLTPAHDAGQRVQQMKSLVTALQNHAQGPFGSDINPVLVDAYRLFAALRKASHEASAMA